MGKIKIRLIQYAALKAICSYKINDLIDRNGFSFYAKYFVTIMEIKVYHKRWKMPIEQGDYLLSLHVIINICLKDLNHKNYLSSIYTDLFHDPF